MVGSLQILPLQKARFRVWAEPSINRLPKAALKRLRRAEPSDRKGWDAAGFENGFCVDGLLAI